MQKFLENGVWGKEPFFKKVFSPQNSFTTAPAKVLQQPRLAYGRSIVIAA